jgi:hypothetical protein
MVIHRLGLEHYKRELLKLIRGGEGFNSRIYPDRGGVPTIGYGYALLIKRGGEFQIRRGWIEDFKKAGINLNQWEQERLEEVLNWILEEGVSYSTTKRLLEEYYSSGGGLEITEEQAVNLFFVSVEWYQQFVARKLGEAYQYYRQSKEFIPLVSMAYNRPALFNNSRLVEALTGFDRVKSYLEIVYDSNPDQLLGIAARRKREGDYFGIWDGREPTIEEAVHFFQVFNGEYIDGVPYYRFVREYEARFAPVFGKGSGAVAYRGNSILAYADQALQTLSDYYRVASISIDKQSYWYGVEIKGDQIYFA